MRAILTRREQAQRRREQLLDAALDVFATKGIAGASVKDIAAAAGVTQGLLYHYFEGKDGLLDTLLQERTFLPQLRRRLETSADRSAADVLPEMVRDYLRVLSENIGLVSLFFSASTHEHVRVAMSEFIAEGQKLVADYLESRIAAGELRPHDTQLLARTLLAAVATNKYMGADMDPDQLVDLYLNGAAAKPLR
jgi:AcrR family transcriptional regulator